MADEPTRPDRIEFKYIFPDDYNPVYVNGAYGGVTPRGEVVVNFFMERHALPYSMTQSLNEDGTVGDVVATEPQRTHPVAVRYVSTGIVLTIDAAKQIREWLDDQIKRAADEASAAQAASATTGTGNTRDD